ncbi:MAG: hypothetical protein AAB473_00190 [Patescibacteria group bacterium]
MEVQQGGKNIFIRAIKNPRVMSVLSVGCMLAFGVLYVGQVNSAATKGYAVRALQEKNVELRHERDRLDMQIAKLRSLDSVTARESFLGLKKIDQVSFVKMGTDVVAVR